MSDVSESSVTCALNFSRVCLLAMQLVQLPPSNCTTLQMPDGAPTSNPPLAKQRAATVGKVSTEAASEGKPTCLVTAGPVRMVYLYEFAP